MPITSNDMLTILIDILENHKTDCCGTVAECQQMKRLINSLLTNDQIIYSDIKPVLMNIYNYCQEGEASTELDTYIYSNQNDISHWLNGLTSYQKE